MHSVGRLTKGFTQHDPLRPNKIALEFASKAVTRMWNWKFKDETYAWHLERLRTRYLTFKAILENPASVWDEQRNVVHGPDDAWRALLMVSQISSLRYSRFCIYSYVYTDFYLNPCFPLLLIKEHPFADAYLKRGEPQWQNLQFIFEQDEEGVWGNPEDVLSVSSGESAVYENDDDGFEFLGRRRPGDEDYPIDLVSTDSDSG
ncbi:hypothetical protein Salat_0835400 [Sesamum alatum]|uniref:Myb/SANT-like domain-containing protein n=1 Tax=Sesamum alatum TaxID=300844 RepID=A0AAE1YIH9_9LAMI|nr:hypothetical protein Salat_0835400 [Sesamum alatum]